MVSSAAIAFQASLGRLFGIVTQNLPLKFLGMAGDVLISYCDKRGQMGKERTDLLRGTLPVRVLWRVSANHFRLDRATAAGLRFQRLHKVPE